MCAGVPMITWPSFADQFFLIVDVARIGVSVGVKEPGAWTMDVLSQTILANKVQVENAVRKVMNSQPAMQEKLGLLEGLTQGGK